MEIGMLALLGKTVSVMENLKSLTISSLESRSIDEWR